MCIFSAATVKFVQLALGIFCVFQKVCVFFWVYYVSLRYIKAKTADDGNVYVRFAKLFQQK